MTAFLHSQVTAIPNQRNAALTNHTVSRSNCPRSQKVNLKRSMATVNTGIRNIVRSNSNITSDFKGGRMRFSLSVSSSKITELSVKIGLFSSLDLLPFQGLSYNCFRRTLRTRHPEEQTSCSLPSWIIEWQIFLSSVHLSYPDWIVQHLSLWIGTIIDFSGEHERRLFCHSIKFYAHID